MTTITRPIARSPVEQELASLFEWNQRPADAWAVSKLPELEKACISTIYQLRAALFAPGERAAWFRQNGATAVERDRAAFALVGASKALRADYKARRRELGADCAFAAATLASKRELCEELVARTRVLLEDTARIYGDDVPSAVPQAQQANLRDYFALRQRFGA